MQKPQKFTNRMLLFLVAVILLCVLLRGALQTAFLANVVLNGIIGATLLIGVGFAFRRVLDLKTEIEWIKAFKRHDGVPSTVTPRLMAPAAALLAEQNEGGMRLSAVSMRSVLDGIASRLEESREISRYFTQLLIFLGLLGTFWGLLGTIGAIGGTINGLSVDGSDMALMFDELKAGLEAPLSGMGTAFSSSLFGLAGSLIMGFMDLQASQAQTRFYNGVEDWLASVTRLSRGGDVIEGAAASPSSYMTALMEQTADGIDRLERTLKRSEDSRADGQQAMVSIAESLAALADKIDAQTAHLTGNQNAEQRLADEIANLAKTNAQTAPTPAPAMDDATKQHIRNLDVGIKRLIEEQVRSSENMVTDLRSELKLLARTMSAALDQAAPSSPASSGLTASKPGDGASDRTVSNQMRSPTAQRED